jgi:hypothetical protein
MEAIRPSETSVHTRSTRRHIPEDGILQLGKHVTAATDMYVPVMAYTNNLKFLFHEEIGGTSECKSVVKRNHLTIKKLNAIVKEYSVALH